MSSVVISVFMGMLPEMKTTEPYSPSARANASVNPVTSAGVTDGRMVDFFDFRFHVLQNRLHATHDERQSDERQRNQHAEARERHLDAKRHEVSP